MTTPLEVPKDFSETIQKNITTVTKDYVKYGTVSQEQLDWLIGNSQRLESLTVATVTLTNAADNYIAALKRDVESRDEEIRVLEQENARIENDNLALLQEIAEELTDVAELSKNG